MWWYHMSSDYKYMWEKRVFCVFYYILNYYCGGFNFTIFAGPGSKREIRSVIHTPVPYQSQATSYCHTIHVEASNNPFSTVCISMKIGCATAVYYTRTSCKFMMCVNIVWRFTNLKPHNFAIFKPICEILSLRKCQCSSRSDVLFSDNYLPG